MEDVVVVGAGFGGLATALELARGGARVTLLEQLRYPGGCASTYTRGGARHESGATLFSGFGPGQLFARWIETLALPVRFVPLDPVITLRAPGLTLDVPPSRDALLARFTALPAAPRAGLAAFFDTQRRVADALWALFDEPALLPPFGLRELVRHALRAPRYLPVLVLVGRPLEAVLARHGLERFTPLRTYLDALCQITVQCAAHEAEAPFALGAIDYPFRGTGHVEGGIGQLADALVAACVARGGRVRFSDRVDRVVSCAGGYEVHARRGVVRAREVVLNLLPHDARRLLGARPGDEPALDALAREVDAGFGACMAYLELEADAPLGPHPHHLELVDAPSEPFTLGNHVFVSISGANEARAANGRRTATVSTHVPMPAFAACSEEARAAEVARVQARMARTLALRAPEVAAAIARTTPGSPRTFARFVGRERGLVGGIPRRAGLAHYRRLGPFEARPSVHLVGDSVFPGQSTLATSLGGVALARRLLGRLG